MGASLLPKAATVERIGLDRGKGPRCEVRQAIAELEDAVDDQSRIATGNVLVPFPDVRQLLATTSVQKAAAIANDLSVSVDTVRKESIPAGVER